MKQITSIHHHPPPPLQDHLTVTRPRFFLSSFGCSKTSSSNIIINNNNNNKIQMKALPIVKNENNNIVNYDHVSFEELEATNPNPPKPLLLTSSSQQAFFLLTFIACTATASFTAFVMAAVPTLFAMSRTAIAVAKLADTAREELPSTMAAIRLSGMEITDLTLELSDLSQEISDGVNKSAQAVQAAEAGVRQIASLARNKTISMIEERANLPVISIQPVVVGVAKKTSQAVGHASKTFMNMISGGDSDDSTLEVGRPPHVDTLES